MVDEELLAEAIRLSGQKTYSGVVGLALEDLEDHVPLERVATCLPVVQEVLQGFDDEDAYRQAATAMWALPVVESPVDDDVFREAIDLYRTARRAGITVPSSVGCLIAACALRHDLEVLHDDRDFPALARISRLRERALR